MGTAQHSDKDDDVSDANNGKILHYNFFMIHMLQYEKHKQILVY